MVNNGGIGLRGYLEDVTDDEIRRLYETNVVGAIAVTRAVLPHMRAAGRGRIVTITSVGGRIWPFGVSTYCSTKFAQEGLTESLYRESRRFGIKVVIIEPGIIKTERWSSTRGTADGASNPESPYHRRFKQAEKESDRSSSARPHTGGRGRDRPPGDDGREAEAALHRRAQSEAGGVAAALPRSSSSGCTSAR